MLIFCNVFIFSELEIDERCLQHNDGNLKTTINNGKQDSK